MPSMKVKFLKNGNTIVEMEGFVGEACVVKAQEVMETLKAKYGITADIKQYHRKSEECPEQLVHVTEKGK